MHNSNFNKVLIIVIKLNLIMTSFMRLNLFQAKSNFGFVEKLSRTENSGVDSR